MLQPGSTYGRYEIRSLLGQGGMGEVYLAHDTQLQRPVALKVLPADLREDQELRDRLEQEALAASALNHPNILTVYDTGLLGDEHFIATEFVDGVSLRQRLMRNEIPLRDVVSIGVQVASALAAAEAVGLVHRDIKPDNIMVRNDGFVKLLDFGLARMSNRKRKTSQTGTIRGTIAYMSPEQFRSAASVDSRADIWSLGVVLYELTTGRLPFEGTSVPEIMNAILKNEPQPLTRRSGSAVPTELSSIVFRTLLKDRERRTRSARDLFDELRQLRVDHETPVTGVVTPDMTQTASTDQIQISAPTNLPTPLTPLLGRDAERDDILILLRRDDVRMVTLTGPGGTGKTRLSLEVAHELLREYVDGVWWISLGPILDPRLVLSEIASVLGVPEGGALLEAVKSALRDRAMLLVLDNFEQILDAAPTIAKLLTAAPNVKALATSRSPLHIRGEREYAVPSLTLPPLDLPLTAEALMQYSSVALFVERATTVKPDLSLTPENMRAIAEICVRLDGLPLAIELAAARVKMLAPDAMLARMGARFKLLSSGARDLPERHQTMRAAISWGYNLLTEEEKDLFATLSIFRGGFSLAAAERLVGDDVMDGVSSLLDKAFLRRDPAMRDDTPRFSMLETIREYGLDCLTENGRRSLVQLAHAGLMARIAEENELDAELLAGDEDNFRTALESAIGEKDAELALTLGASLWWFWYLRGLYSEGRTWLNQILELPGGESVATRAKALTGAGALAFLQCDYDAATELVDQAIASSRALGDLRSLAQSLHFRGGIARERCEYDLSVDLLHLSRNIWIDLEDVANAGRELNYIAFASWLKGEPAPALELAKETLALFRQRKDVEGVAWSLLNLAAASFYSGDLDDAEQRLDESLAWSRTGSFKEGIAWSLNFLGLVLRARGDANAAHVLRDSLRMQWELGDRWRSASLLEALGGVCRDPRFLGAAAALRHELGTPVPPVERTQLDADMESIGVAECAIESAIAAALE